MVIRARVINKRINIDDSFAATAWHVADRPILVAVATLPVVVRALRVAVAEALRWAAACRVRARVQRPWDLPTRNALVRPAVAVALGQDRLVQSSPVHIIIIIITIMP